MEYPASQPSTSYRGEAERRAATAASPGGPECLPQSDHEASCPSLMSRAVEPVATCEACQCAAGTAELWGFQTGGEAGRTHPVFGSPVAPAGSRLSPSPIRNSNSAFHSAAHGSVRPSLPPQFPLSFVTRLSVQDFGSHADPQGSIAATLDCRCAAVAPDFLQIPTGPMLRIKSK